MRNSKNKSHHHLFALWLAIFVLLGLVLWQHKNLVKFVHLNSASPSISAQGRMVLSSPMSPDGKWKLQVEEKGDADVVITHELKLVSLENEKSQTVLSVQEKAYTGDMTLPGTTSWRAAGWSADGKKVYYLTQPVLPGDAYAHPISVFGDRLYVVDLEKKTSELVNKSGSSSFREGYMDVYPGKDRVVYVVDGKLFFNRMRGDDKTLLENPGVIKAILNPSADKIAVQVLEGLTDQVGIEEIRDENMKWYYGIIDTATGRYKRVGEGKDLKRWIDDQSFLVGDKMIKI